MEKARKTAKKLEPIPPWSRASQFTGKMWHNYNFTFEPPGGGVDQQVHPRHQKGRCGCMPFHVSDG